VLNYCIHDKGQKLNKKYYFLTGMPRSGNTLLSAILNQNPKFYSSPLSPLSEQLFQIESSLRSESGLRNQENSKRTIDTLNKYTDIFYSDVNKEIIFDRQKNWTTPKNMELITKYINPKPKIIFTVRDYLEVIASTAILSGDFIEKEINSMNLYISHGMNKYDKIAEYVSALNMAMDMTMLSLRTALSKEYRGFVHFVEYDDLVNNTKETVDKIYNFLEEEEFPHDLTNIKKIETDNEHVLGHNPITHIVYPQITPSKTKPEDIFSEYILKKYANMNIWR
jgi:sulfotransferase